MADTALAKAYVQIVPSAQGIKGSITNVIDPEAKSAGETAGNTVGNGLVSKIKSVIVAAGIGKIIKDAISAGADLEQSVGGIETLYKDSSDTMLKYADEAYKTAGISANEYMQQATSFAASLLQGVGGDTAKAAEASNQAIIDMADNANKMGTAIESIQLAYQGFAKQNYTMLDNLKLGYGGTKTEMERLLADAQQISGVEYNIDNLADVYDAIHVIQGELGITGTTATEAATTLSGSMASMKASVTNLLGALTTGGDVGAAITALSETLFTFAQNNLLPMIGNLINSVPQLLNGVTDLIVQALDTAAQNPEGLINDALNIITTIAEGLLNNIPRIIEAGLNLMLAFGQALLEYDWMTLATDLIGMLSEGLSDTTRIIGNAANIIMTFVNAIIDNLPQILEGATQIIISLVEGIVTNLPQIVETGITLLSQLVVGIVRAIPILIAEIPKLFTSFKEGFQKMDWKGIGKSMLTSILNGLKTMGKAIGDAVQEVWKQIKEFFANLKFVQVGRDIIQGIKDGIVEKASSLGESVKDAASNALQSIKDFFKIGSPSKVMRDQVGKWIPAGIAEGITGNMNPVSQAMDDLATETSGNVGGQFRSQVVENASVQRGYTAAGDRVSTAVYDLLAKYLPAMKKRGNVKVEMQPDIRRLFKALMIEQESFETRTAIPST